MQAVFGLDRLRGAEAVSRAETLSFLFGVRFAAWAVALYVVVVGGRPDENVRLEPFLLATVFLYTLACTLYVPAFRSFVYRAIAHHWEERTDLLLLAFTDFVLLFVLLGLSGGFNTPYYHYTNVALLVLTFLLGWRGSIAVLLVYLAGYLALMATTGQGTDGVWVEDENASLAGIFLTPVMVVVIGQFLSSLVHRLQRQTEQARRAAQETASLYSMAQSVVVSGDSDEMVSSVVGALGDRGRFDELTVYELKDNTLVPRAAHGAISNYRPLSLEEQEGKQIERASAPVMFGREGHELEGLLCLPVRVQGRLWGIVAYRPGREEAENESRLASALANHLSSGLTRLSLVREQEALAAAEERGRIAREIHDGVAQSIYILSLNLERAAQLTTDDNMRRRLETLVGISKETLLEVRYYIFDLKPLLSGEIGLAEAVRGQIEEFTAVSGFKVDFHVEGEERTIPVQQVVAICRIIHEGLANALRHAAATHIWVALTFASDSVCIVVSDDGVGFDLDRVVEGYGLRNMRERAESVGGTLQIVTEPRSGTSVVAALPGSRT